MNSKWKLILCAILVVAVLGILAAGCGKEAVEEEETTTIVVGNLTDLTGPAASSLVDINSAIDDLVEYINEEDPLAANVKLKVVSYDTQYDTSRFLPGYEWLKEKGAKLLMSPLSSCGEALKDRLEQDKIPLIQLAASYAQIEPPGWIFCVNLPNEYNTAALAQYLAQNWTGAGKVKMGSVGWSHAYGKTTDAGARLYAEAHPDQVEWVGSYLSPYGTVVWSTEVEALKDADYIFICAPGVAPAGFMTEYRGRGYDGVFVGTDSMSSYVKTYADRVTWAGLDGTVTAQAMGWYDRDSDVVDLANQLLDANHAPADAAKMRYNISYIGGFQQHYFGFAILREAVKRVGAEAFDGQAFYDTALDYTLQLRGYPDLGFTTLRYTPSDTTLYRWSAADENLVKLTDWIPGVEVPLG